MPATLAPRINDSGFLTFAASASSPRRVRALVAYEGRFTGMSGKAKVFTADLLSRVAEASNGYLNSGVQVPVFTSSNYNHQHTQQNKIGVVVGPFEAHEITDGDLPHPDLAEELVGKFGLFSWVELIKEDAIEDYDSKLLKPISMGVDFSGKDFPKDAVFEISCVGFSAIPGAQLFSKGGEMDPDFQELADRAFDLGKDAFGLRLNDKIAQEQMMPGLWKLFDAFTGLIREIIDSDEEDKDALINEAIADLAVAVGSRLRAVPLDGYSMPTEEEPEEEPEDDMAEIEELRAELAQVRAEGKVASLYSQVSARATELFNKRLITPAQLEEFQSEDASTEGVISCFSKGGDDPATAIASLQERLIELNAIEKYGTPKHSSAFGNPLRDEPLTRDESEEDEADSFLEGYSVRGPLYTSPVEVMNAN